MNTVRSAPHMVFSITGAMTLVARVVRAARAAIRSAAAFRVENSDGVDSSLPIFGRWFW